MRRWLQALDQNPFLRNLTRDQLGHVAAELERVDLLGGDVLFRQGDPPAALYIVLAGRLRAVHVDAAGTRRILREVGPGESVGETTLIVDAPRRCSVYALRDVSLVRLSREGFQKLTARHPETVLHLTRTVLQRTMKSDPPIEKSAEPENGEASKVSNLVIVPLSSPKELEDVVVRLVGALRLIGPAARLGSREMSRQFGDAEETSGDVTAWFDQIEGQHRFVVYVADPDFTPWTQRCLRQADRIVLLAEIWDDPSLREIEQRLHGSAALPLRVELVLVGDDRRRVSAPWLKERRLHAHHHLRRTHELDYGRVSRRLTDHAIGLTFGGGGSRAIAYIGILRAFEEAKIPIDLVASTSAGGIVAAMHCQGWDAKTILERVRELAKLRYWIPDLGPPFVSLFSGRGIRRALRKFYGDSRVEDLPVALLPVATSLTKAELRIIHQGPVWRAVRASLTLPVVWPPIEVDGELFVDGGLLDNLPFALIRDHCVQGCVVACDVSRAVARPIETRYGDTLSGWRRLARLLSPLHRRDDVPSLTEIAVRSATLYSAGQVHREAQQHVDLYLAPPVDGLGMFEVSTSRMIDVVAERGYRYASQRLSNPEVRELFANL